MTDWKPLTEAAQIVKVSPAKLTRMIKQGRIQSHKDARDERLTLVDVDELKKIFPPQANTSL